MAYCAARLKARHMTDWGTRLLLIQNTLIFLAICGLVLWPLLVGVREIFKAVRIVGTGPSRFILTNEGATIWLTATPAPASAAASLGTRRLRLSVLLVCAAEAAFIVFLTVFLFQHADPHGDGMEMVGVGFAVMLIFLPLTLPAFILAQNGRWLEVAAGLSALAAVAYFALWLEMVSELGLPRS
jgi:hypothetical protein